MTSGPVLAVGRAARAETEQALWRAFVADRSGSVRDQIFSLHYSFAKTIAASRFKSRGHSGIEFADLCQLAYTGLLEAIDSFDPDRGVAFRAFASRRIHGAVLDGIAKMTEVRQQVSHRTRMRAERARSLAVEGVDALTAAGALEALSEVALGLALGFMLEGSRMYVSDDEHDDAPDAYESLSWKEALQRLASCVARLPDSERLILHRHYKQGLSFTQIGALLGVTKSRVSQLHRRALEQLGTQIADAVEFHLVR